MRKLSLLIFSLLLILPLCLVAQDQTIDLGSLVNTNFLTRGDSLTNSLAAFAHVNWSQGGVGLSYKHVILMWNKTLLPIADNYKADLSTSVLSGLTDDQYEVYQVYDNIIVGYMIKLGKNFYPYVGTGTALSTDMIKVKVPIDDTGTYTIKGKNVTYGTGIAGFIIRYRKNIILEASMQFKPMLPFAGVGIVF